MKVCVLASGSKGNCTYVETKEAKILIDLGPSSLYVEEKLKEIGVNPSSIDIILLTHTHTDHTNGLKIFLKKYDATLYLTESMHSDLMTTLNLKNYEYITGDFTYKDANIYVIKTSHDTNDSNGYIIESGLKSVVYITDTGYINYKNNSKLTNRTVYVMESNHDIEMLMNGSYPYYLKQRILGDKGHLSNKDSAEYLNKFIGADTKTVILAHLSEENNNPDIALMTLKNILKSNNKNLDEIIIASQKERTEIIKV